MVAGVAQLVVEDSRPVLISESAVDENVTPIDRGKRNLAFNLAKIAPGGEDYRGLDSFINACALDQPDDFVCRTGRTKVAPHTRPQSI